jgi:phage-related protein
MPRQIFFDSLALNDGDPFFTTDYDPDGAPEKNTKLLPIARGDGGVRVFDSYESQNITVTGFISCSTQTELDDAIDTLKSTLRSEGTLRVEYSGTYRLIDCVCKNVIVPRGPQNITSSPYSLQFESESPFWYEEGLDYHIAGETITTATDSFNVSISTTMDAEMVFTLEINEITPDDSDVQIAIGNNSTSQWITVTETFNDGDILVIDCKQKQCFLNGALIRAKGQFPVWKPGSGVVEYVDDASTSRNITFDSANERRFL